MPQISFTFFREVLGCNTVIAFFSLPTRKEKYEEITDKENSKAKTWQTFSSTFRDFAAFKLVGANGNKFKSGSNNVFWAKEIQGNQLIAKNEIAFFYCY